MSLNEFGDIRPYTDAEAVEAVLSQPVGNVTGTVTGLPPYMLPHGEA